MQHEGQVKSLWTVKRERDELLISLDDTGHILVWDISNTTISVIQRIKRRVQTQMLNIHKDLFWVVDLDNEFDLYRIGPGNEPLEFEEKVHIGKFSSCCRDLFVDVGGERRQYIAFGIISTEILNLFSLQARKMRVFRRGEKRKYDAIVISKWLAEVYSWGFDRIICGHSLKSEKRRFKIVTPTTKKFTSFKLIKKDRFLLVTSQDEYVSILNLLTSQFRSRVFYFSHNIYTMIYNIKNQN